MNCNNTPSLLPRKNRQVEVAGKAWKRRGLALVILLTPWSLRAQNASEAPVTQLSEVDVVAHLDEARNQILPSLGATSYEITHLQIENQSQGADAPFNQSLLRAPGVVEDSFGQLHVRGEHANLQYRINGVLLPEGITGFGQELDTRFLDSVALITGALPAQYGFHTAGIIDVRTKNGAFNSGGDASLS